MLTKNREKTQSNLFLQSTDDDRLLLSPKKCQHSPNIAKKKLFETHSWQSQCDQTRCIGDQQSFSRLFSFFHAGKSNQLLLNSISSSFGLNPCLLENEQTLKNAKKLKFFLSKKDNKLFLAIFQSVRKMLVRHSQKCEEVPLIFKQKFKSLRRHVLFSFFMQKGYQMVEDF